ncbi:MAG: polyhydroxyalkanoic acid system family protein, partial [Candidatus Berkelbacteria bacterium]
YTFNANTGRGTLRFRASVATIQGTVVVKANYVEVSCTLPWTVAAFKHSIEQAIKTRAAKVLA